MSGRSWLVSPAPEYSTFIDQCRRWRESELYDVTDPTPPVTLKINPAWLAEKLRESWPEIELDVIEPRPQAYLLNWLYRGGSQPLLGALHRDEYALVLTGDNVDVYEFAAWYRGLIAPEQPLYLYEWADAGVELRPGMKAEDLQTIIDE